LGDQKEAGGEEDEADGMGDALAGGDEALERDGGPKGLVVASRH